VLGITDALPIVQTLNIDGKLGQDLPAQLEILLPPYAFFSLCGLVPVRGASKIRNLALQGFRGSGAGGSGVFLSARVYNRTEKVKKGLLGAGSGT
jgi:hypothetical protein